MEEITGWTMPEFEDLSSVYKGVSHPARISILIALQSDVTLSDVSDLWDISRPTVSDHVEKLQDAKLVYQPEGAKRGQYDLTPLGEYFLDRIEKDKKIILPTLEEVEERRQEKLDEIQPGVEEFEEMDIPVDEEKLERRIQTEIWEEKEDAFNERLQEIQGEDSERIEKIKILLKRYKQKINYMEEEMERRERKLKELLEEQTEEGVEVDTQGGMTATSAEEVEMMMEPIPEEETVSPEGLDLESEDLDADLDIDLDEEIDDEE